MLFGILLTLIITVADTKTAKEKDFIMGIFNIVWLATQEDNYHDHAFIRI